MLIKKRQHYLPSRRALMMRANLFCALCFLIFPLAVFAQKPKTAEPVPPLSQQDTDELIPGDWAPELLDTILNSPNQDAPNALMDATFAAGPAIVPQLEAALKDDRTAEFAAQSLAYIGGRRALDILQKLVSDPRDLNLRRFSYGALGEFSTAQATQILLDVIARSDDEPDRTVTEAAVIAFTVRADESLIPALKQVQGKIKDIVIHDDLENAMDVIQSRAKFLASPEGKGAGDSVEQAVRSYFGPALGPQPDPTEATPHAVRDPKTGKMTVKPPIKDKPLVSVEVQKLIFSPDKSRALAHVVFEDPSAAANYDIVLQKDFGSWKIASAWLGAEREKPPVIPTPKTSQ
jgi:hypothetical protein